MKSNIKKFGTFLQALLLIAAPVFLFYHPARAAELKFRSVALDTAIPAAQASETFTFTVPSINPIGSIMFEHCSNDPFIGTVCVPPTGLSLNTAVLASQTNNAGFSIDATNSTSNKFILTRAVAPGTLGVTTYSFTGIINPNTTGQTVFVRIATYASIDGTGPITDSGSVAYSIESSFSVGAYVPPFLIFCAGITISMDCTSSTGLLINFGELSKTLPNSATSQFSGATNDPGGYSVFIGGQTMTAGNQIINPLAANAPSIPGTGQFGINLRSNVIPVVGSDPSGVGSASPAANYNIPNSYRFVNGEQIAGTTASTEFTLHTVSYIVNVSNAQAAGYYATTITYTAVAAF